MFKALAGQSLSSLDAGISVGNATPSWNASPLGSPCAELGGFQEDAEKGENGSSGLRGTLLTCWRGGFVL